MIRIASGDAFELLGLLRMAALEVLSKEAVLLLGEDARREVNHLLSVGSVGPKESEQSPSPADSRADKIAKLFSDSNFVPFVIGSEAAEADAPHLHKRLSIFARQSLKELEQKRSRKRRPRRVA